MSKFDFPNHDDWSSNDNNSNNKKDVRDGGGGSFKLPLSPSPWAGADDDEDDAEPPVPAFRQDTKSASFDNSFTLSRDFQTMVRPLYGDHWWACRKPKPILV
jgi:hypothetical protein